MAPIVAIVGRPNVGKSSLFNRLAGRRIAIVDPTSGVTRDRLTTLIEHEGAHFELVDSGGVGIVDSDRLEKDIERQIEAAMREADLIVFVTDVRDGVTPLDREVADRLRELGKPTILAANKVDDSKFVADTAEFFALGFGEPLCVSAHHGHGRRELLDLICERLGDAARAEAPPQEEMKLALVGKRNAGKSTLVNALAAAERVIVSEAPGTTRDAVDVRFERDGKVFLAIDTAGVRKRRSLKGDIEFYSLHRAKRSIRRADVVVFLLDAPREISQVDKQLGAYILEEKKPCLLAVTKWDLAEGVEPERFTRYVASRLKGFSFAPICYLSAKEGWNVDGMFDVALDLYEQAGRRASTSDVNAAIEAAVARRRPGSRRKARTPKIYYAAQTGVRPPCFTLFVNDPALFAPSYVRFLEGWLQRELGFPEVPVKIVMRPRREPRSKSD